jgi:uncharacterized protein YjdB
MKNFRFVSAILLPVSLAVTLFACGSGLHSITVTPVNPVISLQGKQQFVATGTSNDGTTEDLTTQATWSSSNPSVATVSRSGLATAVGVGTTTITANSDGTSGSTTLTVTSQTLSITPASLFIPPQATQQFAATSTDNYGTTQDVTWLVAWTSSNTSVATVNSSGLATAISAGTTTITAGFGGIWGSTPLTVSSATLSSISITPANPGISPQGTQQFAATGTFADGTTQDITSQVTWISSNTSVATVSSSGLVTAVAVGTSTITASAGSISGSTPLTVTAK